MFDRTTVRDIREKLDARLADLSKELGVNLALDGNCRFSATDIKFKLNVTPLAEDGTVVPQHEADFKKFASAYGLDPDDLHKAVTIDSKPYTIAGLLPRATVNNIVVKTPRGAEYVMPHTLVKTALNKPKAKRSEDDILRDIRRVENRLSPENLSMDGETSRAHVRREGARLRAERAQLVAELGREPTNDELYPSLATAGVYMDRSGR